MPRVGKVEEVLARQERADVTQYGAATHARVEEIDWAAGVVARSHPPIDPTTAGPRVTEILRILNLGLTGVDWFRYAPSPRAPAKRRVHVIEHLERRAAR